jgi:hypothetical protein
MMTDETPKPKSDKKGRNSFVLVQTNVPHQTRAYPPTLTAAVNQRISLDELARYIVGYLKQKGIVITRRSLLVKRIVPTIDEADNASVSKSPTHGRYFTRIGLDLFVYLDERQESLGRDLLIEESSLFGPMSAWSVSRRMAIFRVDDETSLNRVEETLTGRGFEKIQASRDALEKGFKTGDTSPLINMRTGRSKI